MKPKQTVQAWIAAFNRADADALAAERPVEGRAAIRAMFAREFATAEMVCIPENIFEDGDWVILEWRDPKGLRGCGFFQVRDGNIQFQRGYWDKLSFLRLHNLPLPRE